MTPSTRDRLSCTSACRLLSPELLRLCAHTEMMSEHQESAEVTPTCPWRASEGDPVEGGAGNL